MKIGVIKEIKNNENRVGLTPDNVREYIRANHQVVVEKDAGVASGFTDAMYKEAGAKIVNNPAEVWNQEMVIKVKEPLECEYQYFYEGLILFTYLHLAAEPKLTKALVEKKVTAFAYETVIVDHETPLLRPMSEVAGRRSVIVGAYHLEKQNGGKGVLLSGVPGVKPAKVTIIGGGIAGFNAAQMAKGLGADVTILEVNEDKIRKLNEFFNTTVKVLKSNYANIYENVVKSDLVISSVLIPGAKAPKLVTEQMVKEMEAKSVIVDIAIDQGASVETIDHATTHDDPVFIKHDVIHYSVANMPGAVPKTATVALTNATIKYGLLIAKHNIDALDFAPELKEAINTYNGQITNKVVKGIYGKI